jgi:hypothetical protein
MRGLACVPCGKFFRIKKNGFVVEEGMPLSGGVAWGPYKLWEADLWECPNCGAQVAAGFAQRPLAEHYEPDYADQIAKHPPKLRVNDCGGAQP